MAALKGTWAWLACLAGQEGARLDWRDARPMALAILFEHRDRIGCARAGRIAEQCAARRVYSADVKGTPLVFGSLDNGSMLRGWDGG